MYQVGQIIEVICNLNGHSLEVNTQHSIEEIIGDVHIRVSGNILTIDEIKPA